MTHNAENGPLPCCRGVGECQAPPDIGPCAPLPSAENDAPDLVAWVMPREDARDLLRWLRHNRPLGMPDRTFDGLMDAIAGPACVLPPADGGSR